MEIFRKSLLVQKLLPQEVGDIRVSRFGNYSPEALRYPFVREPVKDIDGTKVRSQMMDKALERALNFSHQIGYTRRIRVHFPNAEHFQEYPFTHAHWSRYENMETEKARIEFMLETYPTRGEPESFRPIVRAALASENPLNVWGEAKGQIEQAALVTYQDVLSKMIVDKVTDPDALAAGYNNAYLSQPIFYPTSPDVEYAEETLWERGLSQIVSELQSDNSSNVGNFLHLNAYTKDPITPVTATLPPQQEIFIKLFQAAKARLRNAGITDIQDDKGKRLAAQLALESSFLSLPIAKDVFYVREDAPYHELPYAYVDLTQLPRGEFTNPRVVLPRIEELVQDASQSGRVLITPIAVSYFQVPREEKPTMFIVDGNNRATALMTIKYLDWLGYDFNKARNRVNIQQFMEVNQMHPGWERELYLTINTLPSDYFSNIGADRQILRKLARTKVPALIVQEPNFHTVAVELSEGKPNITLLQPMHQAIYHQKDLAMGIPPKKQTHGRTGGNNIRVESVKRSHILGFRRHYKIISEQQQ